ncbi:MAG: hypothetical protein ACPG4Z_03995 [Chitinophagales bacterium]
MKISASLYATSQQDLPSLIHELDELHIDCFHIDCFDANFDKIAKDLSAIRKLSDTLIDFHAVASSTEKYIALAKEYNIEKLTFQYENLEVDFPKIPNRSFDLGLSIVSDTNLDVVENLKKDIDFLLLMTTIPGKSGGKFNTSNFTKIRDAKRRFPHLKIHVDGGINAEISFILRMLGVDSAVSGSFLVNHQNLAKALADLRFHATKSDFCVADYMIMPDGLPVLDIEKTNFAEGLKVMDDYGLGFLLLERNGKFVGVCSNADLRKGILKNVSDMQATSLEDIVNFSPLTLAKKSTTIEMIDLLEKTNFPILFLPIIDDEKQLAGALTFNKLINNFE